MSRLRAGSDLTSTFHEKLLVRVLSFLDAFDLFVARMVCVRWLKICEHPDLFRNINMQTFMMYNRYLPYYVLNNFVDSLGLSKDELDAMRVCCRGMPSIPLPGAVVDLERHNNTPSKVKSPKDTKTRAEEKEHQRQEKLRKEKEKRHADLKSIWDSEVLPHWDKTVKNPKRLRELVFQGIPPSVRVKVWPLLVGNELRITPELFEIFGQRAARAKQITHVAGEGAALGREGTVALVHLDLPRTFPALSIFQDGGPCHGQLASVLEAYVCYRPDVGYVQGMSYIAAVLLLNMDEYHAFTCFANLLNNPCYMSFYSMNMDELRKYMDALEHGMSIFIPKVYKHLKELGINPEIYLVDWVLTIFSKGLPLDIASHIWDMVFLEGELFVFQTALGVLKYFSDVLESASFDEIMRLLTHLPGNAIDDDELFKCIDAIKLTPEMFRKFGCRL
jgi:hypothetical protein